MAEFCSEQKNEGMEGIVNKRKKCAHPSCIKQPSHFMEGSKTAEFCGGHAQEGMVNVVGKICVHPSCCKWPLCAWKAATRRTSALNTRWGA